MSFANLKSSRGSSIDKLVKAAEAVSTTKTESNSYDDDRFWKPTRDKAGNGYAVVRFLPAKEGEDLPWVRYWDHGFKGPTGLWYIENSLTSVGQDDPVSEMNSVLWNSGRDEDKATARDRKRRLHYVSNVLVVSDPSNPENEGKVFLYKFGKKRPATGTRWKGIFIKAKEGVEVYAVAEGQIVFSDWITGYGNIIIINHGKGYMSLYGNNQSLLKQPNEIVKRGDVIAIVGNSGGNKFNGVYYELRKNSKPFNPLSWTK